MSDSTTKYGVQADEEPQWDLDDLGPTAESFSADTDAQDTQDEDLGDWDLDDLAVEEPDESAEDFEGPDFSDLDDDWDVEDDSAENLADEWDSVVSRNQKSGGGGQPSTHPSFSVSAKAEAVQKFFGTGKGMVLGAAIILIVVATLAGSLLLKGGKDDGIKQTTIAASSSSQTTTSAAPKNTLLGQPEKVGVTQTASSGQTTGGHETGTDAIVGYDIAYYDKRQGDLAAGFFEPGLANAADISKSINEQVKPGTIYKAEITPIVVGEQYKVILTLTLGKAVSTWEQEISVVNKDGQYYVSNIKNVREVK